MMKYLYRVALAIAVLMLGHSLYFWGGIGLTPYVGDRVLLETKDDMSQMGVGFYTHTGKQMMGIFAPDAAQTYAARQVGQVYKELEGAKFGGIGKIRRAMNSMQNFSHSGTPFAFIVALVLYWLRPKAIKSLGR